MNEISDRSQRFEQARLAHEKLARGIGGIDGIDSSREGWKNEIKKLHEDYQHGFQPENVIAEFYKEVNNPKEYYHYGSEIPNNKMPVDIYIKRKALLDMWRDVMMYPLIEQGGYYYGSYIYNNEQKRYAVAIKEVNPLYDPDAHHSGFRMSLVRDRFAKNREDHYLELGLTRLGFYHSHPQPYDVFFDSIDVDCMAKQAGQPYQTALVIATEKRYAGFFFWEEGEVKRTDNSYFNFFIENEIKSPVESIHKLSLGKTPPKPLSPTPDTTSLKPEMSFSNFTHSCYAFLSC